MTPPPNGIIRAASTKESVFLRIPFSKDIGETQRMKHALRACLAITFAAGIWAGPIEQIDARIEQAINLRDQYRSYAQNAYKGSNEALSDGRRDRAKFLADEGRRYNAEADKMNAQIANLQTVRAELVRTRR